MKKIETLVYGLAVLISLVVFGFAFTSKVNAAVAVCETGDRYCSGSYKKVCNSRHTGYTSSYCTYGCSGGWCKTATCTWTCNDWTACNSSGVQYCNSQTPYPSGCTGGTSVTSRSCTPPCTYSTGDWSVCSADGFRTRSVTVSPTGCSGGETRPSSKEECVPTCTSFGYSTWSECTSGGTRMRSITSRSPVGCEGGNPIIFESCTYIPCSASACYKCDQSNCPTNGCNWGYNGSTSMRCYSDAEAIPTSAPTGCAYNSGIVPIDSVRCGTDSLLSSFSTNTLYTCTPTGWVAKEGCATLLNLTRSCVNLESGNNSKCEGDYCTGLGGECSASSGTSAGSYCSMNDGSSGIVKDDLCLTSGAFYNKCCVLSGNADECFVGVDGDCIAVYGLCYTCDGTSNGNKCTRHVTNGGGGVVGGANGGSLCSINSGTAGLCSSSYGVTITDGTGSDGTFNWRCEGQSSGSCRSSGSDANGSATKTSSSSPVVNGSCKSNVIGTSDSALCFAGTPTFDSQDANHDYINDSNLSQYVWGCAGSTNACGNGTSQTGCTSAISQKAWFRVTGGSVIAKGSVDNSVPTTCVENCYTANGAVLAKGKTSLTGKDSSQNYGETSLSPKTYSYTSLKQNYLTAKGIGTVVAKSTNLSDISQKTGVIFVDGDLTIDTNLTTTDFVMLITSGKITIDSNVDKVDGILMGTNIVASGDSDSKLIINGIVYGTTGVTFNRSYTTASKNDTDPAVEVVYNPNLLFQTPIEITRALSQWKVN